jgi:hypothetical protein
MSGKMCVTWLIELALMENNDWIGIDMILAGLNRHKLFSAMPYIPARQGNAVNKMDGNPEFN